MVFIPRAAFQLRPIEWIVVHHTRTGDSVLEDFDTLRDYFVNTLGKVDIGFHAVAELVNGNPVIQYGRPEHIPGAHTRGFNANSLGVCLIGNWDTNTPPAALVRQVALRVVAPWCVQYHVPVANVIGHREVPGATTTCPGTNFPMDTFRDLVDRAILYTTFSDEGDIE